MSYITKDKRVIEIINAANARQFGVADARRKIEALRPQEKAEFGYLDWEIDEALKEIKRPEQS